MLGNKKTKAVLDALRELSQKTRGEKPLEIPASLKNSDEEGFLKAIDSNLCSKDDRLTVKELVRELINSQKSQHHRIQAISEQVASVRRVTSHALNENYSRSYIHTTIAARLARLKSEAESVLDYFESKNSLLMDASKLNELIDTLEKTRKAVEPVLRQAIAMEEKSDKDFGRKVNDQFARKGSVFDGFNRQLGVIEGKCNDVINSFTKLYEVSKVRNVYSLMAIEHVFNEVIELVLADANITPDGTTVLTPMDKGVWIRVNLSPYVDLLAQILALFSRFGNCRSLAYRISFKKGRFINTRDGILNLEFQLPEELDTDAFLHSIRCGASDQHINKAFTWSKIQQLGIVVDNYKVENECSVLNFGIPLNYGLSIEELCEENQPAENDLLIITPNAGKYSTQVGSTYTTHVVGPKDVSSVFVEHYKLILVDLTFDFSAVHESCKSFIAAAYGRNVSVYALLSDAQMAMEPLIPRLGYTGVVKGPAMEDAIGKFMAGVVGTQPRLAGG